MIYPIEYIDLQLFFAQKISKITGKKLEDVLLKYTSFYKNIGIADWDFNSLNPIWVQFINEFKRSNAQVSTIYSFYTKQPQINEDKEEKKMFGCFSYDYDEENTIVSFHFTNVDNPEPGALSKDRVEVRKNELKNMFQEIKENHPEASEVKALSWLFNIDAFTRLFPPEFMLKHKIVNDWFGSTAMWGQFIDSSGNIKAKLVSDFKKSITNKRTVKSVIRCFPFLTIWSKSDIKYFYRFYGISTK